MANQQPQEETQGTAVASQEVATQECVELVEPCSFPNDKESAESVTVLPSADAGLATKEADALNAKYATMLQKHSDTLGEHLPSQERLCISQFVRIMLHLGDGCPFCRMAK
jgi:hypothetical protein